jgi:hypothetical protein
MAGTLALQAGFNKSRVIFAEHRQVMRNPLQSRRDESVRFARQGGCSRRFCAHDTCCCDNGRPLIG